MRKKNCYNCKKEFNELLNNVKRKVSAIEENPFVDKKGKPKKIPEEIYSKFKPYFCDTIKS